MSLSLTTVAISVLFLPIARWSSIVTSDKPTCFWNTTFIKLGIKTDRHPLNIVGFDLSLDDLPSVSKDRDSLILNEKLERGMLLNEPTNVPTLSERVRFFGFWTISTHEEWS